MATADDNAQDIGPTARRIILGTQLRKLREDAGVSRQEAGYSIRGSDSKISRMEHGEVSFKERDVRDLITMYGVHDKEEFAHYLEFAKQSNQPGWWRQFNDVMPSWLNDLVGLEEATTLIQAYELVFVNGLLQTEEYARAISANGRPNASADDVEKRVAIKMRRQKVLMRPDAPRLWAVMDESVLHRPVGGSRVQREQLEHLLELDNRPNITLQVVPNAVSGYAGETPFCVLRFAEKELPNLVYIENAAEANYLDQPAKTEPHIRAFDRLMVDAHTPERTKQTLNKLRNELK